mmetsp:Transcript_94029/g.146942  ORF Transcript_94029/g.146942 Transcript_94029/m.146942 type:complete len:825 (-) Transcript_94029:128-2602(-)
MPPPRRKAKRNAPLAGKAKKKLPAQGQRHRDYSSTGSSGSYSSRSSDEDESSSCDESSDEDDPRDYKKGGYHPVTPYQLYNARYRVLSKLGAGAFSTVWLCADEKESSVDGCEIVAMKVCKSKKSVTEQAEDEVALLDTLQEHNQFSPHVAHMQSHFWHSGPNGRHKCMVFEVMGENLLALVKHYDYRGLPVAMVRRLARHTLLGLEYIHSRGVIHTDVKLENVLVQRHDMAELLMESHRAHQAFTEQKKGQEGLSKSQKKRLKKKQTKGVESKADTQEANGEAEVLSKGQKKKLKKKGKAGAKGDGGDSDAEDASQVDKNATADIGEGDGDDSDTDIAAAEACGRPVPPVRQKERFDTFNTQQVYAKLADFGNGCRVDRKATDDIQTRQYRSPEVIIGAHWDTTADIWSAACMFFELLTGDFLFDPKTGDNWSRNEDHLALMIELLGDLPPKDFALSGRYSKDFFNNNGKLKNIKKLEYWDLTGVLTKKYKMDEEEADEISTFLLPMLAWQPVHRWSATQALEHFWIKRAPGEVDVPACDKVTAAACSTEEGPSSEDSKDFKDEPTSPPEAANIVDIRQDLCDLPATQNDNAENEALADLGSSTQEGAEQLQAEAPIETSVEPVEAVEAEVLAPASSNLSQVDEAIQPPQESTSREPDPPCATQDIDARREAEETTSKPDALIEKLNMTSVDLSQVTLLVADVGTAQERDFPALFREAGHEIRHICSRYILVIIQGIGIDAIVSAAELARKMKDVSEWISLDEYRGRAEKEQLQRTSKNKTSAPSNSGNDAVLDEIDRAALEEELCREDEKSKKKSNKKKGKK